jgi:hypothetical protein
MPEGTNMQIDSLVAIEENPDEDPLLLGIYGYRRVRGR